MEAKKVEILMEEILRAIKRMDNRLEKIEEKINKIENRIIHRNTTKYSYQYRERSKIYKRSNWKNGRTNNI